MRAGGWFESRPDQQLVLMGKLQSGMGHVVLLSCYSSWPWRLSLSVSDDAQVIEGGTVH